MAEALHSTLAPEHVSQYHNAAMDRTPSQLMSYSTLLVVMKVLHILTHFFILLGVFSNIINMLVFWRLGFATVSNISLFVLSLADLFVLFFTVMPVVFMSPLYMYVIFPSADGIGVMTGPIYYSVMAISSWVTAVITVERCCCILFPMKVKRIFTRRFVVGLLVGMAVYQIATITPHYLHMRLTSYTSPITNQTRYVFDYETYDERSGILSLFFSFTVPTIACFVLVVTGTLVLVVKLRESAEFRKTMAVTKSEKSTTKEMVVARSVIGVCVIYIVCTSPNVMSLLVSTAFPPFHFSDPVYGNISWTAMTTTTLFQAISASINLFVYVHMMTQYRDAFKKMFGIKS